MTPGTRQIWYAQGGSDNAGAGETRRKTTTQEWCRVRYLYGDNVRIPECYGQFMYSSHLITGLDGTHYELWFSPDSLSYFKIRNQETGIWYAHDGSANDGRLRTSKEDWCRVIYYQMTGIVKSPKECEAFNARVTNAIAGNSGPGSQAFELAFVREQLGGLQSPKKIGFGLVGEGVDAGTSLLAGKTGEWVAGRGILEKTGSGFKNAKVGSSVNAGVNAGAGLVVGMAVDYGVDRIKAQAGWTAKDANAGMIAAEVVTTTVASTAITTLIMTAAGASFNPIVMGVGLLVAGGMAAGEEIKKASDDTGIRFESGFTGHVRYGRDLNGISEKLFELENPPNTFQWVNCASDGGTCAFSGLRSVRFGAGDKFIQLPFADGVSCSIAGAGGGKDPAPGVAKTCFVQALNYDRRTVFFVKQSNSPAIYMQQGENEHCFVHNMTQLNAFGGLGQVRVTNTLKMQGASTGTCPYANGFYKNESSPAIYYLSGPSKTPEIDLLKRIGTRACIVPDMGHLRAMGGNTSSNVGVVPNGENILRGRLNMGACRGALWNVIDLPLSDVGDEWAITRTPVSAGIKDKDFTIVRLNDTETGWTTVDGYASRIGGTRDEPWAMNGAGSVFRRSSTGWVPVPGPVATDVGHGWLISNEKINGGHKIYRYSPASKTWINVPGGATHIGGTYLKPWLRNDAGAVYEYVDGGWQNRPGINATDVGAGWAITATGIFRYNSEAQRWDLSQAGDPIGAGGNTDTPAMINKAGAAYMLR